MIERKTSCRKSEVLRQGSTRKSIAAVYRAGIVAFRQQQLRREPNDFIDWPTVNGEILKRFTPSGLNYIKQQAWKGL